MKRNKEIVQWRKLKRGIKKDGTNNTPVLIFEIYYQGFIVVMIYQNVHSCTHHKYSSSMGHIFNAWGMWDKKKKGVGGWGGVTNI